MSGQLFGWVGMGEGLHGGQAELVRVPLADSTLLPIPEGLDAEQADNIKVFHAGTQLEGEQVVTSGGRVLCVTALGDDIASAQRDCYTGCDKISWEGMTLRRDIGWRAIARYS